MSTDSVVPHGGMNENEEDGDLTPPLVKQRANTESHQQHVESSHIDASNRYNTPVKGLPRPVLPKKRPAGTKGYIVVIEYEQYFSKSILCWVCQTPSKYCIERVLFLRKRTTFLM